MKAWWTRLAARIDALGLRERVFLFLTLIILALVLADTLWLTPAQAVHRQITQRVAAQSTELQRLQQELQNSSGPSGPGQQVRDELAQVRARLAVVNQEMAQLPQSRVDETPLTKVLVHFLRRHEGLVLVRTATLGNDSRAPQGTSTALTRQGMELTVAGPYHELARYVQTLERALPALRWGTMRLQSERLSSSELTLQVWLVGSTP
jgi:MSHA biogenesis protein MshJ